MTVFSVQRFLEDSFERRKLADVDGYAIKAANAFDRAGANTSEEMLARSLGRIRTIFFRRNKGLDRRQFEAALAASLRRKYQKKKVDERALEDFGKRLAPNRARFRSKRRSIQSLVGEFKLATEARGIDAFWESRKNNKLRKRPEKIAQAMFALFAKGVVGKTGMVFRELASGVGFVDIGVAFGRVPHLIELKILKSKLMGVSQLAQYMRTEGRATGWLVLIDVRPPPKPGAVPNETRDGQRLVKIVHVDVNPPAPNELS